MQSKWFEFWKNEAKDKDYSELMQQDEIGADTKFMFSEENFFDGIGVWRWANGVEKFLSGLVEVEVRNAIYRSIDDEYEGQMDFSLPTAEFAEWAKSQTDDDEVIDVLNKIPAFAHKVYEALAANSPAKVPVGKLVQEWAKLSSGLQTSYTIQYFASVQSAVKLLEDHGCGVEDGDDLKQLFTEDYTC